MAWFIPSFNRPQQCGALLHQIGVDPHLVGDGEQAVQAWKDQAWDVILMDMQMPVMDGLAATRAIRREEPGGRGRTPIVMLSANAMTQHRLDALAAGADLHIAKPVTAETLLMGITEALEIAPAEATAAEG